MRALDIRELEPCELRSIAPGTLTALSRVTAAFIHTHGTHDNVSLRYGPEALADLLQGVAPRQRHEAALPLLEFRREVLLGATLYNIRACVAVPVQEEEHSSAQAYHLGYNYDPQMSLTSQAVTLNGGGLTTWGFEPEPEMLTGDYIVNGVCKGIGRLASLPRGAQWSFNTLSNPPVGVPGIVDAHV